MRRGCWFCVLLMYFPKQSAIGNRMLNWMGLRYNPARLFPSILYCYCFFVSFKHLKLKKNERIFIKCCKCFSFKEDARLTYFVLGFLPPTPKCEASSGRYTKFSCSVQFWDCVSMDTCQACGEAWGTPRLHRTGLLCASRPLSACVRFLVD